MALIEFVDHPFLKSLIEDLTGAQVVTDPAEPEPFVSPTKKMRIFFDVHAPQTLGWRDNFSREFDEDEDKIVTTQDAMRVCVLNVKAESFVPTVHAEDILETLRLRLQRPSSLERLRTRNMTATHSEAVVSLPTSYDTRVISAASLDIHLAVRITEVDDTDDGNWIETAELAYDPDA